MSVYPEMSITKTKFRHNSCIGVYGNYLPDNRKDIKRWSINWGMESSIGNSWAPLLDHRVLKRLGIQPCITSAKQALGMNRNKRNGYKLKIHVTTADLCTRGGFWDGGNDLSLTRITFVLNFIRFLSEIHGMIQNSKNKHFFQTTGLSYEL